MKSLVTTTVLLTTTALFTGTARAGHDIEELSHSLRREAARTCHYVRHHIWGVPEARHLYADVYEVYRQANHIYKILHRGESLEHVRSDVAELDDHLHHAEELVEKMIRDEQRHSRRGHVYRNSHGRYSVRFDHGSHYLHESRTLSRLRRVEHQLEDLLDIVHEMQDELAALYPGRKSGGRVVPAPPVPAGPANGISFPIGRSGLSFSFAIRK